MNHPLLTTVLAPRLNLLGTSLVTAALAFLLFLPAPAALAFDVELDGNNATAITNLEVDGVLYDVDFLHDRWGRIWPNGTPFDFTTYSTAQAAVEAVTAALNTVPEVVTVGPDKEDLFRIPFDIGVLDVALTWEGDYDPPWNPFDGDGNGTPWADFETVTYAKFSPADGEPPSSGSVDLSGNVENASGTRLCAMVLASGKFDFSCNPNGPFSLTDLSRESDGTVKRQVYVDGFFPKVDVLQDSKSETVVMQRSGTCPDYNAPNESNEFPDSSGKRIDISGSVLLGTGNAPICAMVLANGQFMFSCDETGQYALNIPLDAKGQFKLQVYADGFAPNIQVFDEFSPDNIVRMARATECQ